MTKRNEYTSEQKKRILDKAFDGRNSFRDPAGRVVTRKNAEVDHIVPATKGGKATIKNAQVLHRVTNAEKSNKLSGIIGKNNNEVKFNVNKNAKNPEMKISKK